MSFRYFVLLLAGILSPLCGWAVEPFYFNLGLSLKGTVGERNFDAEEFSITVRGDKYRVSAKNGGAAFEFPFKRQSVYDAVLSPHGRAAALHLIGKPWDNSARALATVDRTGQLRFFEYERYSLTKECDWIVEIAAVSDDGRHVLAKSAKHLPPDQDGVEYVRHHWVIFKLTDDAAAVVVDRNGIDRWREFSGEREAKGR